MVRAAERPVARQGAALDQAGDRPDHGRFQQLLRRQGRQQSRQALRHHRLARARRPDEQQAVVDWRRPVQVGITLSRRSSSTVIIERLIRWTEAVEVPVVFATARML